MTDDSLLEAYLGWLEPQVGVNHQSRTYNGLLQLMARKEFVWLVPNDDNRIADGLDVRREFFNEIGLEGDLGPCCFLEVLVGLSRRLAFDANGSASGWAWQLIENLELHKFPDPVGERKASRINEIMDTVIWRTYQPDGQGGFFPLAWPEYDQTKVELAYQWAYYINEMHPEY